MDCLCCDGGAGPPSDTDFLASVCHPAAADGAEAVFPAEPDRYVLYVIAGCPFAARPWTVMAFYGLCDKIKVVKLFPASYEDGWFFTPTTDGEKELCDMFPDAVVDVNPCHTDEYTHLRDMYLHSKPDFAGAITVPLLWDTVKDTAVSNDSLALAEMMATQMRGMATRNQNVRLFPSREDEPEEYKAHEALVKELHTDVTTAVYRMNTTKSGPKHDEMVNAYFDKLDELQDRIQNKGPYLMGEQFRFADLNLFISLIRLDLAYQWRFGLGRKNVREDYPGLWQYVQGILDMPGIRETIFPRDIMALYFMTLKFVKGNGRTLPQVPRKWEKQCQFDGTCDT